MHFCKAFTSTGQLLPGLVFPRVFLGMELGAKLEAAAVQGRLQR